MCIVQEDEFANSDTVDIENSNVKEEEQSKPPLTSSRPSLYRMFQTVKSEQAMLVVGGIFLLLAESSNQVIPLIVANAYDTIVDPTLEGSEKMSIVNYYMMVSVSIFFAGSVAGFLRFSIFAVIAERMVSRLRIELYGSILEQEIAFFDENKSGEFISRLGSDTTLLHGVVSQSLPEAFVNIIKAIVSLVLIFLISPQLAGVAIGTIVAVCLLSTLLGKSLSRLSKIYQDKLGEAQMYSTEVIGSMRTVNPFLLRRRRKIDSVIILEILTCTHCGGPDHHRE